MRWLSTTLAREDPEILGLCEGNSCITRDCFLNSFPVWLDSVNCGIMSGHKGWTDSSLSETQKKIGSIS